MGNASMFNAPPSFDERPAEGFGEEQVQETETPEALEQEEVLDPAEAYRRMNAELKALKQMIGTPDDARALKSAKDKLKAEYETSNQILQQQVMALSQQVQAMQGDPVANEYNQWVGDWQRAIAQATPEQRPQLQQMFAAEDNVAKRQVAITRKEAEVQAREARIAQFAQQAQQQSEFEAVKQRTIDMAVEIADKAGLDRSTLDVSSETALRKSLVDGIAKIKGQTQPTAGQAKSIPTQPQRGGRTNPPQDFQGWFDRKSAEGKWNEINTLFDAGKKVSGITMDSILRR